MWPIDHNVHQQETDMIMTAPGMSISIWIPWLHLLSEKISKKKFALIFLTTVLYFTKLNILKISKCLCQKVITNQ